MAYISTILGNLITSSLVDISGSVIVASVSGSSTELQNTGSTGFVSNMGDNYTGSAKITNVVTLTSAEYSAIPTASANTLYIVL